MTERPDPPLDDILARLWLAAAKAIMDRAAVNPAYAKWLHDRATHEPEE